jgi:hypothetical protein
METCIRARLQPAAGVAMNYGFSRCSWEKPPYAAKTAAKTVELAGSLAARLTLKPRPDTDPRQTPNQVALDVRVGGLRSRRISSAIAAQGGTPSRQIPPSPTTRENSPRAPASQSRTTSRGVAPTSPSAGCEVAEFHRLLQHRDAPHSATSCRVLRSPATSRENLPSVRRETLSSRGTSRNPEPGGFSKD